MDILGILLAYATTFHTLVEQVTKKAPAVGTMPFLDMLKMEACIIRWHYQYSIRSQQRMATYLHQPELQCEQFMVQL
jgi:hypothetical protein